MTANNQPNGNFCRIVVTAPKSQILLQWQETVCKWGFDPRHWVFQTEIHFYRSEKRELENYAAWNKYRKLKQRYVRRNLRRHAATKDLEK